MSNTAVSKEIICDLFGEFEELELYSYETHIDIVSQGILCLSMGWNDLASKCKDRATKYGFSITTGNRLDGTKNYDILAIHSEEDIECSDAIFYNEVYGTEAEGTINAFQWVLDQVGVS